MLDALHKLRLGPAEYRRCARTLTGCALSYCVARFVGLPELYWAVITALIVVTQPSLNQALNTGRDQIVGAALGAVVGVIGLVAILHGAAPLLVFAIALLPLSAVAALRPTMRLACTTLVIVVLIPGSGTGASPFERPVDRVLEILIGAGAALVAAFIMPNRAMRIAHDRAAHIVMILGDLIASTLKPAVDQTHVDSLHRQSATAEQALDEAITEAGREHIIVPMKRTRADVIAKLPPMLTRLHRDALFLDGAFNADSRLKSGLGDATQRALAAASDAFDDLSKKLGATLDSDKRAQEENVEAARASLKSLQAITDHACESMEKNTVLPFVLNLLVQDFADLVATFDDPDKQE